MEFGSGLGGSVVGGLYGANGSSAGGAAAPAGTSGPTGSPSIVAAAWGVQNDGPSPAWIGMIVLWWSLPR
jgi:hypothetical protein